jgi:hypothetical protein
MLGLCFILLVLYIYIMRELDMSQHGGAMNVYAGYGFGKKWRKFWRQAGRTAKHHAQGIGQDVGKAALSAALSGKAPSSADLMGAATHSAKSRAQNEMKGAIRPYL